MSSRSKSSSRSHSKRGKKQKSYTEKSVARDGINFYAMLFGMISALMVFLLAYNAVSSPPLNEELVNANAANIGTVASSIDKQDFEYVVANSDKERLVEILTGLSGIKKFGNIQTEITHSKRTILVSDRLLSETLTKPQRKLAIRSKLKAATKMFWLEKQHNLGEPDMSSMLRDTAKQYADDADQEVSFLARSELVRLNSLDAASNIAAHGNELLNLLKDFPLDERAHFQIFGSLQRQLVNPKTRHATEKLANFILSEPRVQGNEATDSFYRRISDLWSLCDHNFFEIKDNVRIGGTEAIEQLHDVCLKLLKIPNASEEIIGQTIRSARWLEAKNKYDQAQNIYQAIPKLKASFELQEMSAFGSTRCQAVGKPFELEGTKIDGSNLVDSDLNNMPVIIVYWTARDPKLENEPSSQAAINKHITAVKKSEKMILDVEAVLGGWRPDSIKVVAPCVGVSKNFNFETVSSVAKNHPKWFFCRPADDGDYKLFEQLPSHENPRIALLDRNHVMVDINVPADELLTEIKSLFARSKTKK